MIWCTHTFLLFLYFLDCLSFFFLLSCTSCIRESQNGMFTAVPGLRYFTLRWPLCSRVTHPVLFRVAFLRSDKATQYTQASTCFIGVYGARHTCTWKRCLIFKQVSFFFFFSSCKCVYTYRFLRVFVAFIVYLCCLLGIKMKSKEFHHVI